MSVKTGATLNGQHRDAEKRNKESSADPQLVTTPAAKPTQLGRKSYVGLLRQGVARCVRDDYKQLGVAHSYSWNIIITVDSACLCALAAVARAYHDLRDVHCSVLENTGQHAPDSRGLQ